MRASPSRRVVALALALLGGRLSALHLAIHRVTPPLLSTGRYRTAALFVFGLRLWVYPVFAGSALVQLATAWLLLGTRAGIPLGPLAVPVGATLQAVVGVLLARRLLAPGDTLTRLGAVMRFSASACR